MQEDDPRPEEILVEGFQVIVDRLIGHMAIAASDDLSAAKLATITAAVWGDDIDMTESAAPPWMNVAQPKFRHFFAEH